MLGSWALVTGASSGLGRAIARKLAASGVHLIITARREDRLKALRSELEGDCGVQVEPIAFDVRNPEECRAAIEQRSALMSRVSILVNNAGLAKGARPMHQAAIADWEQMIDTNVKGLLYMTRLVLPYMVERNQGHIVNIGSVAGRWLLPGGVVYCATKFAVRAISEGIRMDLMGKNIRVTTIEPGITETDFSLVRLGNEEEAKAVYEGFSPLQAEDIADAVFWCLDRPPHVNIQELVIFPTNQVGLGPANLARS